MLENRVHPDGVDSRRKNLYKHITNLLGIRDPYSTNRAQTYQYKETGLQQTNTNRPPLHENPNEQLLSRPWLDLPDRPYRHHRLCLQKARRSQGSSSDLGGPQQCWSFAYPHAGLDLLDRRRNRQPLLKVYQLPYH